MPELGGQFYPAVATIDKNRVVVESEMVKYPVSCSVWLEG